MTDSVHVVYANPVISSATRNLLFTEIKKQIPRLQPAPSVVEGAAE
jgi:hypothetical protein